MRKLIESFNCSSAPRPLGNYAHAVTCGDLIFVSGIGSQSPVTNDVPGLVLDSHGQKISYDLRAEARSTLENLRSVLQSVGSDLDWILDVTVFLVDMMDFPTYNEVFSEFFPVHRPARTTVQVSQLPGKTSIEIKCTATQEPVRAL